ncbi:helix-turn-helix domain-containing protein [Aeromicrobium sp. UC242_57]|uniref:helix-turn-helix domain-containing protein n=1 Tax=Aeromicrobium sp. UC242_57 TaxID=3374624 RepID=UPI0037BBAC5B
MEDVIAQDAEGQEVSPVPVEVQPTIKSVQRAARILSAFTVSNPRLTLNQLTESLGSTKATAHRYTMALREAKLVRYSERDTLFSLGPQVLTLSAAARAGMPIIAMAAPLIHGWSESQPDGRAERLGRRHRGRRARRRQRRQRHPGQRADRSEAGASSTRRRVASSVPTSIPRPSRSSRLRSRTRLVWPTRWHRSAPRASPTTSSRSAASGPSRSRC